MNNSELHVAPRQSGKTTKLYKQFSGDPNGILVVSNSNTREMLIKQPNNKTRSGIITQSELVTGMDLQNRMSQFTLYLDEYFYFTADVKKYLFNTFMIGGIKRIVAMSTPKVQYNRKDVNDIRQWWAFQKARKHVDILLSEKEMMERYGEDLMFNLLVCPGVEILFYTKPSYKDLMSKEAYEMEILGNIFKGETK